VGSATPAGRRLSRLSNLLFGLPDLVEDDAPFFGSVTFIQRFIVLFDDFFDFFLKLLQLAGSRPKARRAASCSLVKSIC
jgi:hypothetical protein